eukprot:1171848-Karenia_brevis.AAC.1
MLTLTVKRKVAMEMYVGAKPKAMIPTAIWKLGWNGYSVQQEKQNPNSKNFGWKIGSLCIVSKNGHGPQE